nr:uncharacterized protein LOC129382764 isoform X1 [Dermacentor andersoni]
MDVRDPTPGDSCMSRPTQEGTAIQSQICKRWPTHKQKRPQETVMWTSKLKGPSTRAKEGDMCKLPPTGIGGLQVMRLQLLRRTEDREFIFCQRDIELQQGRLDYDERLLALEEHKKASIEGRQKLGAQCHEEYIKNAAQR